MPCSIFGPSQVKATRQSMAHTSASKAGEDAMVQNFEQIRRIPILFPKLEGCVLFGAMCCIRTMLEVLLIPVKALTPWRLTLRDVLSAYLVLAGMMPFLATMAESPMYIYSYWYHTIRGTSILKLYVIYNMLEVGERLLASFNHDCVEALWYTVGTAFRKRTSNQQPPPEAGDAKQAETPPEATPTTALFVFWMLLLTFLGTSVHAFVLLLQTITLNAALNSDDYSLFALLISNNFMEIKSHVFKKCSLENLFQHVCTDTVERVHQLVFVAVMLLRHAQSEGFGTVQPTDLALIICFEVAVDYLKHFFLARFNRVSLDAYDRFRVTLVWDVARNYLSDELAAQVLSSISVPPHAANVASPSAESPVRVRGGNGLSEDPSGTAGNTNPNANANAGGGPSPLLNSSTRSLTGPSASAIAKRVSMIYSPDFFVRNPSRRVGFTPFAHVALLVWAGAHVVAAAAARSLWLLAAIVVLLLSLQALLATVVDGIAARYVVRSQVWTRLGAPSSSTAAEGRSAGAARRHVSSGSDVEDAAAGDGRGQAATGSDRTPAATPDASQRAEPPRPASRRQSDPLRISGSQSERDAQSDHADEGGQPRTGSLDSGPPRLGRTMRPPPMDRLKPQPLVLAFSQNSSTANTPQASFATAATRPGSLRPPRVHRPTADYYSPDAMLGSPAVTPGGRLLMLHDPGFEPLDDVYPFQRPDAPTQKPPRAPPRAHSGPAGTRHRSRPTDAMVPTPPSIGGNSHLRTNRSRNRK